MSNIYSKKQNYFFFIDLQIWPKYALDLDLDHDLDLDLDLDFDFDIDL